MQLRVPLRIQTFVFIVRKFIYHCNSGKFIAIVQFQCGVRNQLAGGGALASTAGLQTGWTGAVLEDQLIVNPTTPTLTVCILSFII